MLPLHVMMFLISQCENYRIFLSLRLNVKSKLVNLEALNFDFYEFGHFLSAESYQNRNFRSSKIAKKADFECLYSSKLISRKI